MAFLIMSWRSACFTDEAFFPFIFFLGGGGGVSKASFLGTTLKWEIIRISEFLDFALKEYAVFIFKTNLL